MAKTTMAVPDMTIHEVRRSFRCRQAAGETLDRDDYAKLDEAARQRLAADIALFIAECMRSLRNHARGRGSASRWWDTRDVALAPVWPLLPEHIRGPAQVAIADYRRCRPTRSAKSMVSSCAWLEHGL